MYTSFSPIALCWSFTLSLLSSQSISRSSWSSHTHTHSLSRYSLTSSPPFTMARTSLLRTHQHLDPNLRAPPPLLLIITLAFIVTSYRKVSWKRGLRWDRQTLRTRKQRRELRERNNNRAPFLKTTLSATSNPTHSHTISITLHFLPHSHT